MAEIDLNWLGLHLIKGAEDLKYHFISGYGKKIHPTQKPVKLYEFCLKNTQKKGIIILDTHLGSGSIAIACHNMKYDLTACELDKEYYEQAMKRLKEHTAQQRLF